MLPRSRPVFVERLRFRIEELHDLRRVRPVNRSRKLHNGVRRGVAVVGRKRDVAFAIVERGHARDIALAPLLLLAPHLLGRLAQGRAGEARLAVVDLLLRPRQRATDNVVEIGLDRPSRDLLFIDFDGVAHRLLHAVEIERLVARDALRHFLDEAFGDVALSRHLLGIVRDQQIEDRRVGDLLGEIVRACEVAAGIAMDRLEPLEMLGLRGARGVGRRIVWPARGGRLSPSR